MVPEMLVATDDQGGWVYPEGWAGEYEWCDYVRCDALWPYDALYRVHGLLLCEGHARLICTAAVQMEPDHA